MTATYRMLPPVAVGRQTLSRPGNGGGPRVLSAEPGEFLDVNGSDAQALGANGWVFGMLVGPTAGRPTGSDVISGALPDRRYLDTDLGSVIVFDGESWRDPMTGNAV